MEQEQEAIEEQEALPPMSEVSRLGGIFLEPARTLADIARRPTWLLPFVLGTLLVMIPFTIQPLRVDSEAMLKAQVKQAMKFVGSRADVKQIEESIRARQNTWYGKYGNYINISVGGLLVTLAIAGILQLAFLLAGSSVGFKKSLASWSWSSLPPSAVMVTLATLFLYLKAPEDLDPLDPTGNVLSNLGFLVKPESQPVIGSLLGSIDVFSFWRIYLLSLGYAAMSDGRMTTKKAAGVMLVLWVLYIMVKTAITGIFS